MFGAYTQTQEELRHENMALKDVPTISSSDLFQLFVKVMHYARTIHFNAM